MGKLLLWLSLAVLLILGIGTYVAADNPMFWLASPDGFYQILRIVLGGIIVWQIVTSPPRHVFFRMIAGVFAVMAGGWALQQTYNNHMDFFDTAAFVSAGIAILATALERNLFSDVYDTIQIEQPEPAQAKA